MRKFLLSWTLFVSAAFLCSADVGGQTVVRKIQPITSDSEIKLEVTLSTSKKGNVVLLGDIASCKDGTTIWSGEIFRSEMPVVSDTTITCHIRGVNAELWSPAAPNLYDLKIMGGESTVCSRIGFRKFESRDGQFYLNGKPIFLRGNAINPPRRGIPEKLESSKEFVRDYVRFLKGMNVNIIRLYAVDQMWLDVCDEEGMMIFGGCYGRPKPSTMHIPPEDIDQAVQLYKEELLGPYTPHPCVMIYVMTNEMLVSGKSGEAWRKFLRSAYEELIKWDHNKLYICNAGYGLGRSADIYDAHRYWGWYYNTFLTYLNLRDMNAWQNENNPQPITFTECVGNYTGIDGRFNIVSRTKQPGSQKCWTGHTPQHEQSEAALEYQAFVMKNVTELFRRMRSQNPRLGGLAPFSIIFHNWDGVKSFAEMKPKPAAYQYGVSYQPVLLSWETWQTNVYAGNSFTATVHVINDDDLYRDLNGAEIEWALEDINRMKVISGTVKLPDIPYFGTFREKLSIPVPADIRTGYYKLTGTVMCRGEIVSVNANDIFVAGENWDRSAVTGRRPIKVYDPDNTCMQAFSKAGIASSKIADFGKLKPADVLVIAEMSWNADIDGQTELLKKFAQAGGRIVCLRQNPEWMNTSWLPVEIDTLAFSNNNPRYHSPVYTYRDGMNINIERVGHPVFEGIDRGMLRLWSDYNDYDESQPGFPAIYPVTNGYKMRTADLRKVAILANYSRNLSGVALCEVVMGKGSAILSGFDLTSRCGIDPVAEKLLVNILDYASGNALPEPYLYVDKPVIWGDYESENGIVTGPNNGLVVNPRPVVPINRTKQLPLLVDSLGYQYAGGYGGWNNRPGVQYLPHGRRPFAPYVFDRGGSDIVARKDTDKGEGYFLARVPAGVTKMITLLANYSDVPISVSVSVNDMEAQQVSLPAGTEQRVESALPPERNLKVAFAGDRRTVILRTEFK